MGIKVGIQNRDIGKQFSESCEQFHVYLCMYMYLTNKEYIGHAMFKSCKMLGLYIKKYYFTYFM